MSRSAKFSRLGRLSACKLFTSPEAIKEDAADACAPAEEVEEVEEDPHDVDPCARLREAAKEISKPAKKSSKKKGASLKILKTMLKKLA